MAAEPRDNGPPDGAKPNVGSPRLAALYKGERPDLEAVSRIVSGDSALRPYGPTPGGLRIDCRGIVLQVTGLYPGDPAPWGRPEYFFPDHFFDAGPDDFRDCKAVLIAPDPPAVDRDAMAPVVRAMVSAAVAMAALEGCAGFAWLPAKTAMSSAYFSRVVTGWLGGGPFPALGLVALVRDPDGRMRSEGLALFTGAEIAVENSARWQAADQAKIAVRLIDHFVREGLPTGAEAVEVAGYGALKIEIQPKNRNIYLINSGLG